MDILDTSALLALSKSHLESLSVHRRIGVPCIAIWEMLCHLDEPVVDSNHQESFERRKGQILKAQGLGLLNDPVTYWANKIGASAIINKDFYQEAAVCAGFMNTLAGHLTLDDLYGAALDLQSGYTISFDGCSAGARRALEKVQSDYVSQWLEIVDQIECEVTDGWRAEIATDGFYWNVLNGTTAKTARYLTARGAKHIEPENELWQLTYCRSAYIVHKNSSRLLALGREQFTLDDNDAEDAMICGYLDVRENDMLITNDNETIAALEAAFAEYDIHYPEARKCKVMRPSEYVSLYLEPGD